MGAQRSRLSLPAFAFIFSLYSILNWPNDTYYDFHLLVVRPFTEEYSHLQLSTLFPLSGQETTGGQWHDPEAEADSAKAFAR